jgi:hypothetical protein
MNTMKTSELQPFATVGSAAYDADLIQAVPQPLRLRNIHALALSAAALSMAAALEWPDAWRLIAVADLAVLSALFGLAACREVFLRPGTVMPGR